MPLDDGIRAYLYGSATGIWNVDWITFWGVMLFNTLVTTGGFDKLRRWLIQQGTRDVRVQTILFAWAFGALLEGLVGFGYPWAFVAPILIAIGIPDLDAIRVAAIANNAPVSYGALGAPIIALATVTAGTLGMSFVDLLPIYSASVGKIVAILALLPPWILLYLVSGSKGMWSAWPLAIVGSLGYIAGQLPTAIYLGPYLPDVIGAIVCFAALLLLLKVWRPAQVVAYGGAPVTGDTQRRRHGLAADHHPDRGGGRLDRTLVASALDRGVALCRRRQFGDHAGSNHQCRVQLDAVRWRHGHSGVLDYRGGRAARQHEPDQRDLCQDLVANVGCLSGWRVHLRPCLYLQLFGHGRFTRERLLQAWIGLHHRGADTGLHRCGFVG
jgi:hypothetical protein